MVKEIGSLTLIMFFRLYVTQRRPLFLSELPSPYLYSTPDTSDYWDTLSGGNPVRVKSLGVSLPVVSNVAASRALISAAMLVAKKLEGNLLVL